VDMFDVRELVVVIAVESDEEIIRLEGRTVVVELEVEDVHHSLVVCVSVHERPVIADSYCSAAVFVLSGLLVFAGSVTHSTT